MFGTDIIRDSTVGQVLNYLSGGKILPYADQKSGYQLPRLRRRNSAVSTVSSHTRVEAPRESMAEKPSPRPSQVEEGLVPNAKVKEAEANGDDLTNLEVPGTPGSVQEIENEFLIDWDGPNDQDNPRYVLVAALEGGP